MNRKFLTRLCFFFVLFLSVTIQNVQSQEVSRIEPPFWWVDMAQTDLQVMVYGKDIAKTKVNIQYEGVTIKEIITVDNPNYLFLNLEISKNTKAGSVPISFQGTKKKPIVQIYELKQRAPGSAERKGFSNADAIYLLMPDRFSNGDPMNDNVKGMLEKANRTNPDGRHGGDLKGIYDKLDYFTFLGATALWLNPVLENNMPTYSYHGYAITDFYKVDPRFGSNADYQSLIGAAQNKGLIVIKDVVFNHFGTKHWWMNDLPMKSWINQWPEFTRSNYRGGTITDPYASDFDKNKMLRGWFDTSMADFNHDNPFVATYLIQNTIWWIEFSGLGGLRVDTYPYSGKTFMEQWMKRVRMEYPNFSVVGEAWLNVAPQVAYWMESKNNADGFNSQLKHVFDFPLKYAITSAFNEDNGWSTGIAKLYESLSLDYLYSNPLNIINFADNHDANRIFSELKQDLSKWKMAMTFLTTVRGFPQIYYGTEILMTGWEHDGHGKIREDFPGGWQFDKTNAFLYEGRTNQQNEAFDYLQALLTWRKETTVIHNGKLKHYIPEDGVYVYFRYNDDASVMVILNNNDQSKILQTARFTENLEGYKSGTDVLLGTQYEQLNAIHIPARSARIIALRK